MAWVVCPLFIYTWSNNFVKTVCDNAYFRLQSQEVFNIFKAPRINIFIVAADQMTVCNTAF